MDGKKKGDPMAPYTTGSWNTYSMEEYSGPDFITGSTIVSAMREFQQQFKVDMEIVCGPELLFWTVILEARHESSVTRSQRRLPKKVPIRTFKFAVSSDDKLLFSNKLITMNMLRRLSRAFSCNSLKPLKLTSADPVNLLMMHRQSKKEAPGLLKLQHEDYMASLLDNVQHCGLMTSEDLAQEMFEAGRSRVLQSLGSQSEMIPHIQRVNISISNAPAGPNPSLRDFRWSQVEVDVYAPGVFHLYREAAMGNLIPNAPQWLETVRTSGKTSAEAKYV